MYQSTSTIKHYIHVYNMYAYIGIQINHNFRVHLLYMPYYPLVELYRDTNPYLSRGYIEAVRQLSTCGLTYR